MAGMMKQSVAEQRRKALRAFMEAHDLDPAEWARQSGLKGPGSLYQFLNCRSNSLSQPTLEALARSAGVRIEDLFTPVDVDYTHSSKHNGPNSQMIRIPEIDIRAGAGGFGLLEHNVSDREPLAKWEMPRAFLAGQTSTLPENFRIIVVHGDSMAPEIGPGQRLLVDTSDKSPTPPGIFVVFDGFGLVVKRLHAIPFSDPPTIVISSDNERYPAYERTLDEAHIQGRVIGEWRWR